MIDPRDILADDGPVASAMRAQGLDYEPREQQLRMIDAVAGAFDERSTLLVEAGTGVGKSFAYLVPAIVRAIEQGQKVVVATNTIALQEQIIKKDLPFLQETLSDWGLTPAEDEQGEPIELRPVLVKGRGNYLSIRRLKLASERQAGLGLAEASKRSLEVIQNWAYETHDGTLSTLPAEATADWHRGANVWDLVQSDSDNCMGRKCPYHEQCFYQSARKELMGANLFICNHAMFFADLALRIAERSRIETANNDAPVATRGGVLPDYDHVVLDEAHMVEDVASDHLGVSLSEGRVGHLLRTLYDVRKAKRNARRRSGGGGGGYLDHLRMLCEDPSMVDRAVQLVLDAHERSRDFFDSWLTLIDDGHVPAGRVREPAMVDDVLSPVMRDLSVRLRRLRDYVKLDADRYELNSYARRAAEIADNLDALLGQTLLGCAYWVETRSRGRGAFASRSVTLACSPIEVGPILKEQLFDQGQSVVLTSATLATRTVRDDEAAERAETAFMHVMERLGCAGARALQLGSPFAYTSQMRVIVDTTMPHAPSGQRGGSGGSRGNGGGGGGYNAQLAQRIIRHVRETDGGAFVLFTSLATMQAVAQIAQDALDDAGLPMLVQNRDGPRTLLLEQFKEHPRSVLFGAASFWQGVDVRGDTLRNVIITKLPFEPPDRPLTQARLEWIEDKGGNPFMEESLPRAVIRFKQGVGRLIRSHSDSGRVVILDPRVVTARYGRLFSAALPAGVRVELIQATDSGEIDRVIEENL